MYQSLLLLLASLVAMSVLHAAEWTITANANPSIQYDDNVLMEEDKQDSFHFAIRPTTVMGHALENSASSISVGYKIDRYMSLSELDTENPFIQAQTQHQTERSEWGLSASYVEDSTRTDAADDTGDFTTQSIVTTKSIAPSYSYQLTERDSLSVNGSYSERNYSTTDYDDNETKSLTTAWQHQYTERLSGGLSAAVYNYQADGPTRTSENDNYNLSLTVNYQWTEEWQVDGRIGVRHLKSEDTDSARNKEKNTNTGSAFDFSLKKQGEIDSLTIGANRTLSPSSTGEVDEQLGVNINWSRNLSETLTASIRASYQETTSALDDSNEKRENINFSPSLRWQFERNVGLDFSYNYRQQNESDQDDVDSNAVMLTLTYDWDEGLRASR